MFVAESVCTISLIHLRSTLKKADHYGVVPGSLSVSFDNRLNLHWLPLRSMQWNGVWVVVMSVSEGNLKREGDETLQEYKTKTNRFSSLQPLIYQNIGTFTSCVAFRIMSKGINIMDFYLPNIIIIEFKPSPRTSTFLNEGGILS